MPSVVWTGEEANAQPVRAAFKSIGRYIRKHNKTAALLAITTGLPLLSALWLVAQEAATPYWLLCSVFAAGLWVASTMIFAIIAWPQKGKE